jgi:leucyl aminopeptidase
MQKVTITKIEQIKEGSNMVFLVDMDASLTDYSLSKQEIEFIKGEFEKKNNIVFVNRYSHWVYFVTFDRNKKRPDVTEILRKSGNTVSGHIQKSKSTNVALIDCCGDRALIFALTEGLLLGNYQFLKYFKDSNEKKSQLSELAIMSTEVTNNDINQLDNLLTAVFKTRDLVNEPASYLTSQLLSQELTNMGKEAGFGVEVFDKNKIAELKMGGILSVNKGSTEPPTFTVLTWKPSNALNAQPVVLVGKGVVYDSGGYSLKPTPDSMDYMKCDMAGAAAVASVVYTAAKNKLPVYLVALIPSTDNRIGPDAYSPGDVITISDGTTVEVMNTDAEGRLILADALVYAQKYNPQLVITVATLTGAAHRAIGSQGIVGMGNAPEQTMQELVTIGNDVFERIAVFPFWDDYKEQLKSDIADLKNIGGELAGAITAGKFLEHFTNYPFIHLDIAGMSFSKKAESYKTPGASGIGVRLLYKFLENSIK